MRWHIVWYVVNAFKDAHNRFIVNMKEAQDSLFIERIDTAYHNGVSWHKQLHEVNKQESSFKNDHTGQAFYVNKLLTRI